MSNEYPAGYTPMTEGELFNAYDDGDIKSEGLRNVERAVLARLPKPDAEPVAWLIYFDDGGKMARTRQPTKLQSVLWESSGKRFTVTPLYAHPPKPAYVPALPEVEARVDAAVEAGRINDRRDAERDMLVARISYRTEYWVGALESETQRLLRDIRAHLVGGGA